MVPHKDVDVPSQLEYHVGAGDYIGYIAVYGLYLQDCRSTLQVHQGHYGKQDKWPLKD